MLILEPNCKKAGIIRNTNHITSFTPNILNRICVRNLYLKYCEYDTSKFLTIFKQNREAEYSPQFFMKKGWGAPWERIFKKVNIFVFQVFILFKIVNQPTRL